jgi:hypothetical protein
MKADPSRQQTSLVLRLLEDGQREEYCEDGGIQGMKGGLETRKGRIRNAYSSSTEM